MRTVVVYVHGLWLGGGESFLLRRRLARALDAETCVFSYSSVGADITANAMTLGRYLRSIEADRLHLVAHSMGGLVILKLFELGLERAAGAAATGAAATGGATGGAAVGEPWALPPGRIVFTGSPVRGSRSAERLARLPFGRAVLGLSAAEVLLQRRERRWPGGREVGVIAGELGLGLGRLLGPMGAPNDGTVWLEETDLPGATAQLRVRVSHSGMVFSSEVARQVAAFLRDGRFAD
jgi:pimeloyl-ACP methyl ester carboxylesterase